jgi:hypothetical protein
MGRGHALAGVAIAVKTAHAESKKAPQQSHFLGANLPGAEECDAVRAVPRLRVFDAEAKFRHRYVPIHGPQFSPRIAQ